MPQNLDLPYSLFKKAFRYFHFLIHSKNRHGVHSPFTYRFIENVLRASYSYPEIENERETLLKDHSEISVEDFGSGENRSSPISKIAEKSLKKPKEAQLLAKMVRHFNTDHVIELGTSLGITSAYLATASSKIQIHTIEGSKSSLTIAQQLWNRLGIRNIHPHLGEFDTILSSLPQLEGNVMIFVDGNHRYQPTLDYFNNFLTHYNNDSIIVFDDIHWSQGMEKAWKKIVNDNRISLSIDLFEIGIVFLYPRLKKEHFNIRS